MGAQFTATSMIGTIALAGIIVRNSILLVDFINQQGERRAKVCNKKVVILLYNLIIHFHAIIDDYLSQIVINGNDFSKIKFVDLHESSLVQRYLC